MAPIAVDTPTAVDLTKGDIAQNLKANVSASVMQNGAVEPSIARLDASKLIIQPTSTPRTVSAPASGLKLPTDHMISCEWTAATGWAAPYLTAYAPITLEPSASCLHYATECFEGLKTYRGVDGQLRVFRTHLNAERLCRSAARVGLPTFDPTEVEKLIHAVCAYEAPKFLPASRSDSPNAPIESRLLYVRPMMIGTDADVGIKPPTSARLLIFLNTFPAIDRGFLGRPQPGLKLLASKTNEVRAWPGGFGAAKLGANYGPSLIAQREAARLGYDQVLWLYSYPDPLQDDTTGATGALASEADTATRKEGVVTEAGASNFFVVWKTAEGETELVTAPLTGGLILEGVTRRSVLELTRQRLAGRLRVTERWFTMAEVARAQREGRLLEAFAVGTAYFVTPVARVCYAGHDVVVPNSEAGGVGPVAEKLRQWLRDIVYGVEEHEWAIVLSEKA